MACCPSHDDKSPSLSVSEAGNHILIHCFAGCEPSEILAAVNMQMSDLMPERDAHYFDDQPPQRPKRETRSEADLAHIQIRYLEAEAMVETGHKLTAAEKKQAIADFEYLRGIGELP